MVLAGNAGKGSARQVPDVESFVEPDNSATTEASVQIEILIGGKSGVPAAHLDHVDGSKRPQVHRFSRPAGGSTSISTQAHGPAVVERSSYAAGTCRLVSSDRHLAAANNHDLRLPKQGLNTSLDVVRRHQAVRIYSTNERSKRMGKASIEVRRRLSRHRRSTRRRG